MTFQILMRKATLGDGNGVEKGGGSTIAWVAFVAGQRWWEGQRRR